MRPDLKGEANLKRGINGIYHQVSKQHLYRYLTELDLRYNTRKIKDGERTLIAVKQAGGKRLKLGTHARRGHFSEVHEKAEEKVKPAGGWAETLAKNAVY